MNYLIRISYDGSAYYGFQRLNNNMGVQNNIESVLSRICKEKIEVKGAGRTDRGVHAIDQCISFSLPFKIPPERLKKVMNSMLDDSIYVNNCEEVDKSFHARFNVKEKEYEYIINVGDYDVFKNNYLYNYNKELNIDSMKEASNYFLGVNDFKNFTSGERKSYISIIKKVSIKRKKDNIIINFKGKSFYRYMVRNMVGALMEVGKSKKRPEYIKELLENKEIKLSYTTVPSSGLYLKKIKY